MQWVAISFSRGSSQPRDRTQVSCIAGRCFTVWVTREAAGIKNRLVDSGREREGGPRWESSIETYTLPYVKLDRQWKFALWCRELKPGALWEPLGWDGVGGGRGHKYTNGWFMTRQKPTQYCKAIILQLKINFKTKTNKQEKIGDLRNQQRNREGVNWGKMGSRKPVKWSFEQGQTTTEWLASERGSRVSILLTLLFPVENKACPKWKQNKKYKLCLWLCDLRKSHFNLISFPSFETNRIIHFMYCPQSV